jgi:hypothetical protein
MPKKATLSPAERYELVRERLEAAIAKAEHSQNMAKKALKDLGSLWKEIVAEAPKA